LPPPRPPKGTFGGATGEEAARRRAGVGTKATLVVMPLHAPEWERQLGETDRAWRCFLAYRDMDPRSQQKVADLIGCHITTVRHHFQRWSWVERVRALDNHLESRRRIALDTAELSEARKWSDRRASARERDWRLADLLSRRAYQMLQWPLTEVTEDVVETEQVLGQTVVVRKTIVVKPLKWSAGSIPGLLSAAQALTERSLRSEGSPEEAAAVEQAIRDFAGRQGISAQLLLEMSAELSREVAKAREEGLDSGSARAAAHDLSRSVEGDYDLLDRDDPDG